MPGMTGQSIVTRVCFLTKTCGSSVAGVGPSSARVDGDPRTECGAVNALPVLDLFGHLLGGQVAVGTVAVDDQLVHAVLAVGDALGGQPREGGAAYDRGAGPVPGRRVQDPVVAVGVDRQAAEAGQGACQVEGEGVEGLLAADGDVSVCHDRLAGEGPCELVDGQWGAVLPGQVDARARDGAPVRVPCAGSLHGDESADDERLVTVESSIALGEADGPGVLVQAQGRDEASAVGESVHPGQVPGVDGDQDGVEAAVRHDADGQVLGVGGDHADAVVPGLGQVAGGAVGDGRVDVEGGDAAGGADEFGDQGGVVAAGADLQDVVAGLETGGFQHLGLQPGCRDGAGDAAVAAVAGGDDVVRVCLLGRYFGGEGVPGHGAQGLVDRGGADVAGVGELVGQLVAQCARLVEAGGGRCRHGGPFGRAGHTGSAAVGAAGFGMLAVGAYCAAWASNMAAYRPRAAMSSSCVPCSARRP